MPIINFIRGRDKRTYVVLDVDTNTLVKNVYSMRSDKGECAVYRTDDQGKLILDNAGNPAVDILRGNFRLLRHVTNGEYRILERR